MDKIDVVEREFRAMLAKMTGGLAPEDYGAAFMDWWLNLAKSPEKQAELQQAALKQAMDLWRFNAEAAQGKPLAPKEIRFVHDLPKTRNAKVMRRVIRAAYLGNDPGDVSSLENPHAVEQIRRAT